MSDPHEFDDEPGVLELEDEAAIEAATQRGLDDFEAGGSSATRR